MKNKTSSALAVIAIALAVTASPLGAAHANPARDAILAKLAAQAKAENPHFSAFSADRGKALFLRKFTTGKPDTPSCSTCHTMDPRAQGKTRAGKTIKPMAVSRTPTRFTDPKKVAKWFRRNCKSVIGRACTATEKGDYITFMNSL